MNRKRKPLETYKQFKRNLKAEEKARKFKQRKGIMAWNTARFGTVRGSK